MTPGASRKWQLNSNHLTNYLADSEPWEDNLSSPLVSLWLLRLYEHLQCFCDVYINWSALSCHKIDNIRALEITNARYFTARQNGDTWIEENKEENSKRPMKLLSLVAIIGSTEAAEGSWQRQCFHRCTGGRLYAHKEHKYVINTHTQTGVSSRPNLTQTPVA